MRKRLGAEVKTHLEKARESAILAVVVYNKFSMVYVPEPLEESDE